MNLAWPPTWQTEIPRGGAVAQALARLSVSLFSQPRAGAATAVPDDAGALASPPSSSSSSIPIARHAFPNPPIIGGHAAHALARFLRGALAERGRTEMA